MLSAVVFVTQFVPDLENIIEFAKHAGKGQEGTKPKTDADTDTKENEEKDNIDEDDEEEEEVEEIIGADLSEESVKAAANLDDVLSTLMKNFSEGTCKENVFQKFF